MILGVIILLMQVFLFIYCGVAAFKGFPLDPFLIWLSCGAAWAAMASHTMKNIDESRQ